MHLLSDTLWNICCEQYFPRNLKLRSPKTRAQYRFAIDGYGRHLGRVPTLADLDDDLLLVWTASLLDRGLSAYTVREKVGRITAVWTWLAKRRIVERFPTLQKPDAPEPVPVAAREDELRRLFKSAAKERGTIAGVPADLWWTSLLAFLWSTGERRGAALALRREWVDLGAGVVSISASVRKGRRKAACYHLWPSVLKLLDQALAVESTRELVWPWPWHEVTFYNRFGRIAVDAGLPDDRKHKCHLLRVSHATWRTAQGGDASKALMHSDPATTRRHYLDPRLLPPDETRLFAPWE